VCRDLRGPGYNWIFKESKMGTAVVRYTHGGNSGQWGVLKEGRVHALALDYEHHADVMAAYYANRADFDQAIAAEGIDSQEVSYEAPLSKRIQMFAQGLNYASHRAEGGLETEEDELNLIFYKASSTICGPNDDVIRPRTVELLDYEIELGIILKKDISDVTVVTEANLPEYVGGLVLCNDVSARDEQFGAPVMQWFKGKSFRTFCPVGPVLYLMDEEDFSYLYDLNLELKLNGEVRQQSSTDLLIHKPPKTLTDISEYADIYAGDCVLTGTPGGVITGVNPRTALAIVLNFRNDKKRRAKFTAAQKARAKYMQPGDVMELSLKTADGAIDLGTQRSVIAE
jgi:2-keto-4-pentenoate hydratase/2-oxohepta-3-ene-1,7-dioic acid hydratase in catechol pathway